MRRTSIHPLLVFLMVVLLLAACGSLEAPAGPPTSVSRLPTADWRTDWLKGVPCAPPCFQGIMPGTTSQTATLNLLRTGALPVSPEVLTKPGRSQGVIRWDMDRFDDASEAAAVYYTLPLTAYTVPLNTILVVRLGTTGVVPIQAVLDAYGEPSHVLALAQPSPTPGRTVFILELIYLPQGFSVKVDFDYDGRAPQFDATTQIERVYFFMPTLEGVHNGLAPLFQIAKLTTYLVPWEGFQPFTAYCQSIPLHTDLTRVGCP